MKVYLAGGMSSDWQDRVMGFVQGAEFYDPRQHGLSDPDHYTAADLFRVRCADVLFAYLEADNPSGVGLTLEIGYALGLGKPVIFVDEKGHRYGAIVRSAASVCVDSLDLGLGVLRGMVRMKA